MRTLRVLIAAVTLLAVAVQPVAASLLPCCCTRENEPAKPCCRKAEQLAEPKACVVEHSCCAKRSNARLHSSHDAPQHVLRKACCCIKSLPATAALRSDATIKRHLDQHWLFAADHLAKIAGRIPVARHDFRVSDRLALSGPPLLALYCTWLI